MEITSHQLKHCDLVQVTGHVDNHTAPQLAQAFEAIHKAGRFKIVFDMSGVDFISSAGLRVILNAQKACKKWNRGEVVLAGLSPQTHRALSVAGFISLFRFFDAVEMAVGSF